MIKPFIEHLRTAEGTINGGPIYAVILTDHGAIDSDGVVLFSNMEKALENFRTVANDIRKIEPDSYQEFIAGDLVHTARSSNYAVNFLEVRCKDQDDTCKPPIKPFALTRRINVVTFSEGQQHDVVFPFLVADDVDLVSAVQNAVHDYLETSEGHAIYISNCSEFNWGDVDAYLPEKYLQKYGVMKLPQTQTESTVERLFDEDLADP